MLRHYDRATHHYFVPGTNTFRNMCDLLAGMKANLTPGRKGAVAQRGLRPRGRCDFASRSGSQGGCMWMNVDGVAEKGEFMWMKIHVHPPTSTYMQVHPHKMFFGRPIGHGIAQTIARLAQPSNFQLIPTYFFQKHEPQSPEGPPACRRSKKLFCKTNPNFCCE